MGVFEIGFAGCPPQKKGSEVCQQRLGGDFLRFRFEAKNMELRPFPAIHRATTTGLLCTADCVAEREGFYYRRYLQVPMNTTLPREYPLFELVTSETDLRVQFL